MNKLLQLICLLFFFIDNCFAQQLSFKNFTVEDGLAGSGTNFVIQDSKGYIWLATATGVSRFDGTNFNNFTIQNGLPDNAILRIYEDRNGRIWFFSFNGIPSYFFDNKIVVLDTLKNFEDVNLTTMIEDECGTIWFGTFADGLFKIENKHLLQKKSLAQFTFSSVIALLQDSNQTIWMETDSGLFLVLNYCNTNKSSVTKIKPNEDSLIILRNDHNEFQYLYGNETTLESKSTEFFKIILRANLKNVKEKIKSNSHNLWIEQSISSPILTEKDSLKNIFLKTFKNKFPSGFLEDCEKNIWMTTLFGGVYFLPYFSREFFTYTVENGLSDNIINALGKDKNGSVWAGTATGKINRVKNGSIDLLTASSEYSDKINCILLHSDGSLWYGTDGGIKIYQGGKKNSLNIRNVNSLSEGKNGTVWAGTINGLATISAKMEIKYTEKNTTQKNFPIDVVLFNDSIIWIGNKDGLWTYDFVKYNHLANQNSIFSYSISSIKKTASGVLWIATQSNGVIVYYRNKTCHITIENGLCDNRCNEIGIDEEENAWIATDNGISKITLLQKDNFEYSIINFNKIDGLISGEVNDIMIIGHTVWAATAKGLTKFDEKKILQSEVAPPIYFTGIKFNEQDSSVKSDYILNYTENNIRIDYVALSFGIAREILFKYKLEGIDTSWQYTDQKSVHFPLLPPSKYTFIISARNKNKVWSESPAIINFTIQPPFWQTKWFRFFTIIIITALLILVYFLISRIIKKRERKRNELKRKIMEAEQKALRAQMNPHFIFNALNSIQRFVLDHDILAANEYLAKFGKLIRRILDNSKHSLISLSDEIETLKLYLELESLRFENKFSYSIIIDPLIDINNSFTPPMLIQPYVENAIWHGLMNQNKEGKLDISLKLNDEQILCSIEDNGVGRKKSIELKNKNRFAHQSSGMQLTQERLDILNAERKQKFEIKIIDLLNDVNEPCGTKVEITIPINL